MAITLMHLSSLMGISDSYRPNQVQPIFNDSLDVLDSQRTTAPVRFTDSILVEDNFQAGFSNVHRTIIDTLILNDAFRRAHEFVLYDYVFMRDSFYKNAEGRFADHLIFTETFTVQVLRQLFDVITTDDSFTYNMTRTRILSDVLVLQSTFSFGKTDLSVVHVGHNAPLPATPESVPPTPTPPGIPYVPSVPTRVFTIGSLTLPWPEFNNKETFKSTRVEENPLFDKSLILFIDEQWPTEYSFEYTFKAISEKQMVKLKEIFTKYLGLPVDIVDHLGREYTIVILNPDTEFVTSDIKGYDVSINMQLISGD